MKAQWAWNFCIAWYWHKKDPVLETTDSWPIWKWVYWWRPKFQCWLSQGDNTYLDSYWEWSQWTSPYQAIKITNFMVLWSWTAEAQEEKQVTCFRREFRLRQQPTQSAEKRRKTANEDKDSRVDDTVDKLREKHQTMSLNIQYRVRVETMVGGRQTSYDHHTKGAYFKWSKGSQGTAFPSDGSEDYGAKSSAAMTPVRAAQLNSMYIKQIGELHSLLDLGAITSEDFLKQKNAILDLMNNLHWLLQIWGYVPIYLCISLHPHPYHKHLLVTCPAG